MNIDELIKHLNMDHNKTISVKTENFSNFDEFLHWKEDFEKIRCHHLF